MGTELWHQDHVLNVPQPCSPAVILVLLRSSLAKLGQGSVTDLQQGWPNAERWLSRKRREEADTATRRHPGRCCGHRKRRPLKLAADVPNPVGQHQAASAHLPKGQSHAEFRYRETGFKRG
jgi:hypothetical protein